MFIEDPFLGVHERLCVDGAESGLILYQDHLLVRSICRYGDGEILKTNEPVRKKTNNLGSDQV